MIPTRKRDTRATKLAEMLGIARKAGDCTETEASSLSRYYCVLLRGNRVGGEKDIKKEGCPEVCRWKKTSKPSYVEV